MSKQASRGNLAFHHNLSFLTLIHDVFVDKIPRSGPNCKAYCASVSCKLFKFDKKISFDYISVSNFWRSDIWHCYTVNILRPTGFSLLLA